jgi:hypothetical protein
MIQLQDHKFIFHKVGGQIVTFEAANEDTTSEEYQYFGYLSAEGAWIIQRFHVQTGTVITEYAAGHSVTDYLTHWHETTGAYQSGDPALTFKRFDEIHSL